ncbi:hypothetical protein D0962_34490 [Leptolyngbyaceae cyanobacterium CCMR0082]|uniref:Uncharacterized protein n=1 Tax=Adonisia turfae CCMR0082 TaxID=2304604 RepID=A0A6M0SH19_9CYAN|nr:hypothetical protein [Adonisia turfae]NEZ67807.1 hypothetical protein [Adonisia turfae CCMR0082]
MESNPNGNDHSASAIQVGAQKITDDAYQTGCHIADVATQQMDSAFTNRLAENIVAWGDHHCRPEQYDLIGDLAGRFFNSGRRQSVIELMTYSVVMMVAFSVGLYVVIAPLWLYPFAFVLSLGIGLVLSLSGTKKQR